MATKIKFLDFLTMFPCSVTRLGNFLISWDKIFSQQQPKYLMTFWAFEIHHPWSKNCCGYLLGNFWKIGATLYSNIWSHCFLDCFKLPLSFWYQSKMVNRIVEREIFCLFSRNVRPLNFHEDNWRKITNKFWYRM